MNTTVKKNGFSFEDSAKAVVVVALAMFAFLLMYSYFSPSAVRARESEAGLNRAIQLADNMDYMMNPGLRDADRRAGRAERNGY